MLLKNIVIAWRNLVKNRVVSFINILGLTLGLASAVLAIIFARHELTYESSHHNADRISKVYLGGSFGVIEWAPSSFGPEGQALSELFPEVEAYSISRTTSGIVRVGDNLFTEDRVLVADTSFYSIFTIPFPSGAPSADPGSVVLSRSTAMKYFGNQDPSGETLTIELYGQKYDFVVTGIYSDLPSNTHLKADIIIPFTLAERFGNWKHMEYQSTVYNNYVLLSPGANVSHLNSRIRDQYEIPVPIDDIHAFLMPVKDIHFRGTFSNNRGKFLALLIGGFFVLVTSCFNYINLTNILFATRRKEIGIRKVNGASRGYVFGQLLVDTILSTLLGFILAVILLELMLPWFNSLMDTSIRLSADIQLIGFGLLLFFLTASISGLYPAIKYSATKTTNLLKDLGNTVSGKSFSRRLLTTFQFILAIIFIQMILVIDRQGHHLNDMNVTGYDAANVLILPGNKWGDLNIVKSELLANPSIEAVSWGSGIPSHGVSQTSNWKDEHNRALASTYFYQDDFPSLYGIAMTEGRFFSESFPGDMENSIVINRLTSELLGYDDPVGETVMLWGNHYEIIGVIDDYMALPPIFPNNPALIRPSGDMNEYLIIKIKPGNRMETHEYITGVLSGINPDYPVNIRYHDEVLWESEEARSFVSAMQLMQLFFLITIIASLIGLFGLSMFIAQRNMKEVGIRKVFGATVGSVVMRISREMIVQVFLAILIATPVAIVITRGYLSVFQYRIEPGMLFFFSGGLAAFILVVLTVSWQTWRAANRNPIDVLRHE
jgi:putative ABC transport system permease protein